MSTGATAIAVGEITHNALVTQIGFAILGAATGNLEAASAVGFGAGFTESGGNLKAGLYAAATAAAFYEVGSAFQVGGAGTDSGAAAQKFGQHAVLRYETHVVADGLVGGVSSEVMGGGFKPGFIGAGFGEAASGLLSKAPFSNIPGIHSVAGNVTASALIGGTASELSGGKFANGAATAAFAQGFGEEAARQAAQARAGMPLPGNVIDTLKPYFGSLDLTQVRVRNGIPFFVTGQADGFTFNKDIYFARGAYNPNSAAGIALIAHEVLHVQQFQQYGRVSFTLSYFSQYVEGRLSGLTGSQAYRNISFERKAYGLQRRVYSDLSRSRSP